MEILKSVPLVPVAILLRARYVVPAVAVVRYGESADAVINPDVPLFAVLKSCPAMFDIFPLNVDQSDADSNPLFTDEAVGMLRVMELEVVEMLKSVPDVPVAVVNAPVYPEFVLIVIFPDVVIAAEADCPVGTTSPTDVTDPLPLLLKVVQSAAESVPVAEADATGMLRVMEFVEVEMYHPVPVVDVAIASLERTLL